MHSIGSNRSIEAIKSKGGDGARGGNEHEEEALSPDKISLCSNNA